MKKTPSWQKRLSECALVVEDNTLDLYGTSEKWMFIFHVPSAESFFHELMLSDDFDDPWDVISDGWDAIFGSGDHAGVSSICFRKAGGVVVGEESWAGSTTGPCYDGLEIKRIASAVSGMSWPLRYIVFAKAKDMNTGIFADRESLSTDAVNQYKKNFGRFTKLPFDDKFNPQTKDKFDDCIMYSPTYPDMKAVDYLYSFNGGMPSYYPELRKNFTQFCKNISIKPKGRKKGLWKKTGNQWNASEIENWIVKHCGLIGEAIFDEIMPA